MKTNFIFTLFIATLLFTSCDDDDNVVVNTTTFYKYKKTISDPNTNVVGSSIEYDIINNKIQTETVFNNYAGTTTVIEYNYANQLLASTVNYLNGVLTGKRVDYTYNSNGRLIERLTTINSSNYGRATYIQTGNITSIETASSTDGINFTIWSNTLDIVTDTNDNITSFNGANPSANFLYANTLTYDSTGNLISDSSITDNNGNISSPQTITMTYTSVSNPFSSLMNDTFTKYGNNLNYNSLGGINTTINGSYYSPKLVDQYTYNIAPSITTVTNVLNSDGLVESISLLTTMNGTPFTLVKEEFFYQ